VAAGAFFLAGGLAIADGGNERASACYSYREAKAKWPGAYLTWKYDEKRWQCWAPKGGAFRAEKYRPKRTPTPLPQAEDIAPEFPQPEAIRIEQPPWPRPGGLGWVWEPREPFEPARIGDNPVPVYSTFDGEPPDIWPEIRPKLKTAGNQGLPAVWLLLAFLAGGMFLVVSAVGVESLRGKILAGG